MKRKGFQLSNRHRAVLYSASLLLLVSGAAWAWANHLDNVGALSANMRSIKVWLLRVHGISAMLFVFVLGTLVPEHMRRAWRAHKNRLNGGFFSALLAILTVSGYLLYYLGDENWRDISSDVHLYLGLGSPACLLLHILVGRRSMKKK